MTLLTNLPVQQGVSISYFEPLVKTDRNALSTVLTDKIDNYQHEIRRIGGYWSAKISMTDNEQNINQWIQEGVGRHIEVHNPAQEVIFEGFVNKIGIKMGEDTYSIGPLNEIANRIATTYSTVDTSSSQPTIGKRATTAVANNTNSQDLYGIWYKIFSINGATQSDAEQLRDQYVNDFTRVYPAISGSFTLGGGGTFNITLDILGYWHWLKSYFYTNSGSGDVNLSDKIQDILGADPNSIFSTDYSKITSNTTQVSDAQKDQRRTADTLLKNLNSRGDSSNNAYSIGFYNDRRLVYETLGDEIEYEKRRGQVISDNLGGKIEPWDVKPNEWLFRPDFLVGLVPPITAESLGSDPRTQMIETVKYSTPYGLSVNGIKLSELDQALAKRGMGSSG